MNVNDADGIVGKFMEELYQQWRLVQNETIALLGRETALHIIHFHADNWRV